VDGRSSRKKRKEKKKEKEKERIRKRKRKEVGTDAVNTSGELPTP